MLKDLIARFARVEDAAPLPPDDARLALAALMVRAARADGAYETVEQDAIRDVLARRHELDAAGAAALLADAEAAEAAAPDTVRFTRLVKQAVPYEDRADVMEALWTVALADGRRDPAEDAALRQIAPLIGVSDRDNALARQRAAAG